ncbi:MAG: hypothetical protein IKZ53_09395 [Selenomonadaceae bacterium]|nr:hypothetical protein [Selenomonadaceae bacterium]
MKNEDSPPEKIDDNEPIKITDASQHKVFRSKKFLNNDSDSQNQSQQLKKRKFSHAETSGIAISAVMLVYSLSEEDKPLFFLSTSLLIFLLRPLIGALFGKYNRAVQNALHSFSLVLFIGALIFLFL